MNVHPRATFERATREYDREFQKRLTSAIVHAIAEASIVTDPDLRVMALRVGETLEALSSDRRCAARVPECVPGDCGMM
jgi:hypothetical protein